MDKRILVVDDERPIADILKFNLEKEGFEVTCAYDGVEALSQVEKFDPDLILLDKQQYRYLTLCRVLLMQDLVEFPQHKVFLIKKSFPLVLALV